MPFVIVPLLTQVVGGDMPAQIAALQAQVAALTLALSTPGRALNYIYTAEIAAAVAANEQWLFAAGYEAAAPDQNIRSGEAAIDLNAGPRVALESVPTDLASIPLPSGAGTHITETIRYDGNVGLWIMQFTHNP